MKMRSLLMLSALLLGGCSIIPYESSPAPAGKPGKATTAPVSKPETGAPVPKPVAPTALALAMADAFVQAPAVKAAAQSGQPVLLLTPPQNGTAEPVDTRAMAAAMSKRIQSHSAFRFVDPAQVAAITGQLEYQQAGMNPASLVRLGRQTGAGYMLYGDLAPKGSRYTLSMSLMDLQSGELLWSGSRTGSR